ncbi:MAG: cation diffusion facilitator family transporter [Streptococcaceae bacterium]|jgi:cation diffusion facilitator family transporter|nr:cation diffusion facilitator family transporter [Streptococcaceae bacterium]
MMNRYDELKLAEKGVLLSIVAYIFLSGIKLAIGEMSNSQSLIADAFNNITDVLGNLTVLIGLRLARRPADDDHAYGHWKIENVASLITSFIMLAVGFEVLLSTIKKLFSNTIEPINPLSALVGVFAAIIMLTVYLYNKKLAERLRSPGLLAAAKDNLSDAVTSIATTVAILGSALRFPILDKICAVIITFFIFKTAYDIFSDSAFSLSDGFDEALIESYRMEIFKIAEIKRIVDIRGRTYGSNIFLDVVIEMDPNMSVYDSHQVTEIVERRLKDNCNVYDIDIHVEPYSEN